MEGERPYWNIGHNESMGRIVPTCEATRDTMGLVEQASNSSSAG
jgi:hypothetical protein